MKFHEFLTNLKKVFVKNINRRLLQTAQRGIIGRQADSARIIIIFVIFNNFFDNWQRFRGIFCAQQRKAYPCR
ncbi:MAG: hypothetical protein ACI4Q4_04140, partial [Oscillospiraceae bacterium]